MASVAPNVNANVRVSQHPCLQAKLSQFRSKTTDSRDTNRLVHDIALLLASDAFASALAARTAGTDTSPLGYTYPATELSQRISVVPILRSGLGMVDAVLTLLPAPAPVHHLGLFREPVSLQPVEYYNNLPNHTSPPDGSGSEDHVAVILDPIIATGGTAVAAIQTLRDWGVSRIVFLCVLASAAGLQRAAEEWPEGTVIWVGGIDQDLDGHGYLNPGCGDVGDRLFLTKGR